MTLIEILVAVVLMGTVVVAVLVALQVNIRASTVDRNQANIYAWLQAASDEVYNGDRTSCTAGRTAVIAAYDQLVQAATPPPDWNTGGTIRVTNVQFLGRTTSDGEFEWRDDLCFESGCPGLYCESPLYTQKVTIRATAPGGALSMIMETIKSE
jgi:type II secretory pathway pseudopilin PulG